MYKDQEKFYREIEKYNSEYKEAIKKLIELDNINVVLSSLTALIMQYIENHLKSILQDYFEIEKTAHDLNIDNHRCRKLLNNVKEKYKKYLKIDSVNNQFLRIEECINYMEGIYGENTMINARYPIDSKNLTVNRKEHKVISEQYKMMFTILMYAIESLVDFYGIEKIYQKIAKTTKPKEHLQDFINFCNSEYKNPKNIIKVDLIKKIDIYNDNILEKV